MSGAGAAGERIVGGGAATATAEQARRYLLGTPGCRLTGAEAEEIVWAFRHWGALVGVRWDVAFAQSCHETKRYLFDGQVAIEQRNPAGIGATNDGAAGLTFPNWVVGIGAYFVHLLAWCDRLDLARLITAAPAELDPRVPLVAQVRATKGAATTWASLGGRWAVPGDGYGEGIARHHAAILAEKGASVVAPAIIDVRDQLPRDGRGGQRNNPGFMGFPAQVWPKVGAIVHYSGPAVDRSAETLAVLRGYARYHIDNLPEWGIAYHYDIGNDARIRQCRDPRDVLYHCGAWPYNATWFAVHVMIGEGQRATAAQLAALAELLAWLGETCGYDARRQLKGHQEVSQTACPGTLTGDFIVPYRAGTFALGGEVSDLAVFPETGRGIQGSFRRYWEQTGGLRQHGFPLTGEVREVCEDGQERTVQYFERAVFELHPDAAASGYEVMERRTGAAAAKAAGYSGPGI